MGTQKLADLPDTRVPGLDPPQTAALIETCRAHAASVIGIADAISQALHEFFEYEPDEPHLGMCFDAVCQLLEDARRDLLDPGVTALSALSVVASNAESTDRASEICAAIGSQRQNLLRARHITLSTLYVMRTNGIEQSPEVSETTQSLRDLEQAIQHLIDGLDAMTPKMPTLPLN